MGLFAKKSLQQMIAAGKQNVLPRRLNVWQLIAIGVGGVVGAGIFVRTAEAAGGYAGSAVVFSFLIAAICCTFSALCYAELAAMMPVAGGAYTYAYATLGELIAWVVGWALILEYALSASLVAIAWSEYFNDLLRIINLPPVPYEWTHSFLEISPTGVAGIMNIPSVGIVFLLTLILIRGTGTTATVNNFLVLIKVSLVLLIIILGWQFINPSNHEPFMIPENHPPVINPNDGTEFWNYSDFWNHGIGGVLRGSVIVFFAFIGFDVVATAAQEAKNPKRDMPIGIVGSLVFCTLLYILFAFVLTGIAPFDFFVLSGKEASVSMAIKEFMQGYQWLATTTTFAIIFGFTSVIMMYLLGQSRVFFTMSRDGLLPPFIASVHKKFKTPYKSSIIVFLLVSIFSATLPVSVVGGLTTIGTLIAFMVVCLGVLILRKKDPHAERPFKVPFSPFIPILGIVFCGLLISFEHIDTQFAALIWLVIGLIIYFAYGRTHSHLKRKNHAQHTEETQQHIEKK